jgi:hypothetical protein
MGCILFRFIGQDKMQPGGCQDRFKYLDKLAT